MITFATWIRCYVRTTSTATVSTKLCARLNRAESFSILCSYGHRWSPIEEFLRTSCKQGPTSRTQTSSCYSGFHSHSLEIFHKISLRKLSQKCIRIFILSWLFTFLCQSSKNIYIYIHVNMEFLYCGMLSSHGKIFRRETIMILCVIVLNITKIVPAGLRRFYTNSLWSFRNLS